MDDLVSVIMPSYNTEKFISDAVKSVLAQTYKNWELIIVDDCSTDGTDKVLEPFLTDSRIVYIKNKENKGAAYSRNLALERAKGKWIAFLDSDDLWKPEKLTKQIAFMEKGGYSFSYTDYEEVDENSNPLNVRVTGPKKITKTGMYNFCWPGCLTVMYNAEVIGRVKIVEIQKNNDYAMWLKICQKQDCYLLNENLAIYRRARQGSISNEKLTTLIKWHYKLFVISENKCPFVAGILTVRNLFFGFIKKIKYVG